MLQLPAAVFETEKLTTKPQHDDTFQQHQPFRKSKCFEDNSCSWWTAIVWYKLKPCNRILIYHQSRYLHDWYVVAWGNLEDDFSTIFLMRSTTAHNFYFINKRQRCYSFRIPIASHLSIRLENDTLTPLYFGLSHFKKKNYLVKKTRADLERRALLCVFFLWSLWLNDWPNILPHSWRLHFIMTPLLIPPFC